MFYYSFKLALRNLLRNKTFSFINIFGLSIGLASCIIIGLYVYSELSFDKFHHAHNNIYRVNKITGSEGRQQTDGITPGQLAPAVAKDFPEVIHATRFRPWFTEMLVSRDTVHLKLDDVAYADNSFLQTFDFSLLKGNRNSVLAEPFTAVVTETTAKKYFKDSDPIGKTLITLNNIPVKITGVAKDVPRNSSLQFNMLISWATVEAPANKNYFFWMNTWQTQVDYTFLQLKPNTDISRFTNSISKMMHEHFAEKEFKYKLTLQPLDDIHLHSQGILYAEQFSTNSSKIVYTLVIIAGIILLIACFNFINLSTAGALKRAKETGVQKVLGANQSLLIRKFFAESFFMCLFSMLSGIIIVIIALPFFNNLASSNLSIVSLVDIKVIAALLALLLIVSFIAGLYPAVFLSRFKSTDVFRNIIRAGKDNWLRKSLVTTQFALSILLIISTIVVNNQIHYITSKDLGFDKERVMVMELANSGIELNHKSKEFMTAIKQNPAVLSVSASNRVPGQTFNGYGIVPEGHTLNEHLLANVLETDADYASTYDIKLKEGRYFSPDMKTDTSDAIVVNEAMVRYLNDNKLVGKQFEIYEARKGKVIGVIKDFNFASLREAVQPLAIILNDNPLYVSVKLKPGSTSAAIDYIQKQWKQFDSENPFDYFFVDEELNHFYKSDTRLLHILSIFAMLAIFIACIGLFGLSIYSTRQRVKEISIRKILGAPVAGIVTLLSKDFLKLVSIAALIAFPVSWWAMNKWLQDFAYRVTVSWWIFISAGIAVLFIALATVSYHSIKAAMTSPAKNLRTE